MTQGPKMRCWGDAGQALCKRIELLPNLQANNSFQTCFNFLGRALNPNEEVYGSSVNALLEIKQCTWINCALCHRLHRREKKPGFGYNRKGLSALGCGGPASPTLSNVQSAAWQQLKWRYGNCPSYLRARLCIAKAEGSLRHMSHKRQLAFSQ